MRTREIVDPIELTSRVRTSDITRDMPWIARKVVGFMFKDVGYGAEAPVPKGVPTADKFHLRLGDRR